MKKLLAILLCLGMILTLGACSSNTTTEEGNEPSSTDSTTSETFTVGVLQLVQHDALDNATQGFVDALTDKLGDAVTIDVQNAQGDTAQCTTIATSFVSNDVDLIMANATPAVQAALSATTTIPVLGTSVTDYASAIGQDLTADGATGINLSGTSDGVQAQLYVDTLLEIVPDAKKVSILFCSSEANSQVQSDNFIAAMKETAPDVECTVFTFSDSNDLQAQAQAAVQDCDAMYIPTDNTAAANMPIVSGVTIPAGIPTICGEEGMTKSGGLATVSISYYDIGYKCGEMAVEILTEGKDVSTMPIGYAENLVGEYNPEYAEAIGITIPDTYTALDMSGE